MSPTATLPSAADAAAALNSYQAPSSADLLSSAQQKYGVNDLQSRVSSLQGLTSNLTNAISAVDPSVTGRTAGSLVTEGQRSALVSREQQPLQTNLASENQALGTATGDLNTAEGNAKDMAAGEETDSQNKYNQLLQTYQIANAKETAAAQAASDQAKEAESEREFNVSESDKNASAAANSAAGYSVKQLSSGNKAYTGPNGQTNLYQYASALAGGDPSQTFNIIKQQLQTGSATDKGAYNGIVKLEQQGMSQADIIARLKASNGYIFN